MKQFVLSLLLCVVAFLPLRGQTGHFFPSDRFSSSLIANLCQDKYGSLWIATDYGLNRFDGSHNAVFRNIVDENGTYENNIITALFEYEKDIWFGGSFGLYLYHRDTNTSSRFDKRTKYGVNISSTVKKIR